MLGPASCSLLLPREGFSAAPFSAPWASGPCPASSLTLPSACCHTLPAARAWTLGSYRGQGCILWHFRAQQGRWQLSLSWAGRTVAHLPGHSVEVSCPFHSRSQVCPKMETSIPCGLPSCHGLGLVKGKVISPLQAGAPHFHFALRPTDYVAALERRQSAQNPFLDLTSSYTLFDSLWLSSSSPVRSLFWPGPWEEEKTAGGEGMVFSSSTALGPSPLGAWGFKPQKAFLSSLCCNIHFLRQRCTAGWKREWVMGLRKLWREMQPPMSK